MKFGIQQYIQVMREESFKYISILLVSSVIAVAFAPGFKGIFLWDDEYVIKQNLFIRNMSNFGKLFTSEYFAPAGQGHYTRSGEESYRPVVTFSYFVDYFLYKNNSKGYHATNIILHILVSILILGFLQDLGAGRYSSFIGTLLFAVNPVTNETVNMISYREDLLAAFFMLLAFKAWIRKNTILTSVSYILALFSKEMALSFLPLILLHDFLPVHTKEKPFSLHGDKSSKLLITILIIVTVVYLFVLFFAFPSKPPSKSDVLFSGILSRMLTMVSVYGQSIHLALIPYPLKLDYTTTDLRPDIPTLLFLAIGLSLTIMLILVKRKDITTFLILWFWVTLFPVSGIYPITNPIAERYLYIPLIGSCGLIGIISFEIIKKNKQTFLSGTIVILLFIAIFSGGYINWKRSKIWSDEEAFYREMIHGSKHSYRGYTGLGISLLRKGALQEAADCFKKAVIINPDHIIALHDLGIAELKLSNKKSAMKTFRHVIEKAPDFPEAHYQLAMLLMEEGDTLEAEKELSSCLEINRNFIPAKFMLAVVLQKKGNYIESANIYKSILAMNPSYTKALKNLGLIELYNLGHRNEGFRYLSKYLELVPDDPQKDLILSTLQSLRDDYSQSSGEKSDVEQKQ